MEHSGSIRFGLFEFNHQASELRKRGLKVKIGLQACKVLALLLEHPGQLRTREELLRRLWPTGTFVDFEHSLNKAIHALRDALGDSATSPRYIETIVGQGYRFIPLLQEPSRPAARSRTSARIGSVAVLPFVTQSGEPEIEFLGTQITSRLIDDLSRLPGTRILAYSTIKHCEPLQANPQRIGEDLGVRVAVFGELGRRDSDVFVHVELIDVADGTQLWGTQLRQNCQQIIDGSEQLAKKISRQLQPILASAPTKVMPIVSKRGSLESGKPSASSSKPSKEYSPGTQDWFRGWKEKRRAP
jgi:DNA-binding winged helix-turn-helix (wHTH) protein